ncbi:MAG: hypothetical protein IJP68_13010, partial [Selenomonadaceae bacterium]|nr:hypothetical protein [Selenomonadaceae bacterium]
MANVQNLMTIAPTQPTTPTRTTSTSQSTQSRYKPPARAGGKKNFSSTLDKINAKLDELKQNIRSLQETDNDAAQVETDIKEVDDAPDKKTAQGKSKTPQDAPQKAIRNEKLGISNDSEEVAEEDSTADIFLRNDKSSDEPKVLDENSTTNVLAANSLAYLFSMNSESLLQPASNSNV